MKRLKNRKGFTLIELLAVIIILAILMTLAITAMSRYIVNARKDTFITTAQQYANAARLSFVNNEYDTQIARGNCIAVKTSGIELESGSTDSPFGNAFSANDSNVVIRNVAGATDESDKYEYYVQMVDSKGNGFGLMREADVDRKNVIQEKVKSAPSPADSYQTLPASVSESTPKPLKLFKGGASGTADGSCNLVAIY